jgi:hypothetical protein
MWSSFAHRLTSVVGLHNLDWVLAGLLERRVCHWHMVDLSIATVVLVTPCDRTLAGSTLVCGFVAQTLRFSSLPSRL